MNVADYICKNCGANKNGKCLVDGKLVKDSDIACSQIFKWVEVRKNKND